MVVVVERVTASGSMEKGPGRYPVRVDKSKKSKLQCKKLNVTLTGRSLSDPEYNTLDPFVKISVHLRHEEPRFILQK